MLDEAVLLGAIHVGEAAHVLADERPAVDRGGRVFKDRHKTAAPQRPTGGSRCVDRLRR